MNKNIITIIIAFVITLSVFNVNVYSSEKTDYSEAIEITSQLEIFMDEDFRPKSNITRAEAAAVITRLMGYNYNELPTGKSEFYDVSEAHWAVPYINKLQISNIMTGDGKGYFNPDDNITFNQMVKILMSIAGYGKFAEVNGGYPEGYNKLAADNKLFQGIAVKGDNYITREETAKLIYNSFDIEVVLVSGSSGSIMEYDTDGTTVLEKYMNIYKTEGIIKANSYTRTAGKGAVHEGRIELNGVTYGIGNTEADKYIGCNVMAYYKSDDDDEYIAAVIPRKNEIYEITAEDFVSYEDNYITYELESGKIKKYKISETPDVIFNGEYKENPLDEYFEITDGNVTLIDNNSDGVCDVINIRYAVTYFLNTVGESEFVLKDMYGQDYIDYEKWKDDKFIEITLDGAVVEPSELQKYDVLDIYPSEVKKNGQNIVADPKNSNIIEITVTRNTVEGKISSVSEEYVVIDESEYGFTGAYELAMKTGEAQKIVASYEGTFCLNSYGKIAGWKYSDSDAHGTYLYITKARYNTEFIEDDDATVIVRALNISENEWENYECKNRIKLNGSSRSKAAAIMEALMYNPNKAVQTNSFVPQLVAVKFNDDGLIISMDTAYVGINENKNETLSLDLQATMYYKNYTLDSQVAIPTNGVRIIKVPASGALADRNVVTGTSVEDEYRLYSYPPFSPDKIYPIDVYNLNDVMASNLMVYYSAQQKENTSIGYYTVYMMVDGTYVALNDEDEVATYIKGYVNGSIASYEVSDECQSDPKLLSKGDVIYMNSESGKVNYYKQVLDAENIQITENGNSGKRFFASAGYGIGKAYAVEDRCLRVSFENIPSDEDFADTASCNLGSNTFMMYDRKNNTITSIYPEDIWTYKDTQSIDDTDTLFLYSNDAGFKGMFIIRQ